MNELHPRYGAVVVGMEGPLGVGPFCSPSSLLRRCRMMAWPPPTSSAVACFYRMKVQYKTHFFGLMNKSDLQTFFPNRTHL